MNPNDAYYHHKNSLILPPILNLPDATPFHNPHHTTTTTTTTTTYNNYQDATSVSNSNNLGALSTSTTTTIVDDDNSTTVSIFSNYNNTNNAISITFRQARQRSYFAVQHGQILYCEPYKYNVRLSGVKDFVTSPDALYSFELHMRSKMNPTTTEYMPLALQMEKQMKIRGSPNDCMDYRIYFAIDSRAYAGSLFFVLVRDSEGVVQCTTSDFLIGGRGKKRTESKKQKRLFTGKKQQQEDNEDFDDTVVE